MKKNELFLKTAFCCMACDGSIAEEELSLVKSFVRNSDYFIGIDVETYIRQYINDINEQGVSFLSKYLDDITDSKLPIDDEFQLAKIAIEMIEADNNIDYSEISFFKEIRKRLSFSNSMFLQEFPDKEDYILSDINENYSNVETFNFYNINFN